MEKSVQEFATSCAPHPAELKGMRAIVMGLGRFGGGVGVTRWLTQMGTRVTVTDLARPEELADSMRQLDGLNVRFRLGGHDVSDLADCDLLVVSPAVDKRKSEFFIEARRRGIPCTSEMNLFLRNCTGRLIGVTGSVGKSTTTAMIGAILQRAAEHDGPLHGKRVFVGGNIGRSLLDDLPAINRNCWVVLELSSFQLKDAADLARGPQIAVITNLRPNHLDRHDSFDDYADSKLNIARYQKPDDVLIVHERESDLQQRIARLNSHGRVRTFGGAADAARFDGLLRIPGRHNIDNAAAAWAVADELGIADPVRRESLAAFAGLPHRLEFVREIDGVRYYNDSKATTPEAACTALAAFEQPVVLLAGGYDKHVPFDLLAESAVRRARAVVCFGAVSDQIAGVVRSRAGASPVPVVERVADLSAAVAAARRLARAGDVVVLSPACASYDQFINYEQRGERFRQLVQT